METFDFLIIGGGLTGGYGVKTLVEKSANGNIGLISADSDLPYDRPPLSKGFLLDKETEDGILINPREFYDKNHIKVYLNTKATKLDVGAKKVTLSGGEEVGFKKLLLATGATPKSLDNIPTALKSKIHYLRSLQDSKRIKEAMKTAIRAHEWG